MPFATHRGQRIHYTIEGSGPLVILQHGLLLYWQEQGRCYFPFRPRARIWYHRPRRGSADTSRFALFGKCWSGQPNAKLIVEVR